MPRMKDDVGSVPTSLTLESLGELGCGQARAVIERELNAAIRDCEDRGEDKKARKVVIEVELKKVNDETMVVNVSAKATTPKYRTENHWGKIDLNRGKPELKFSPVSLTNPEQKGIPFDEQAPADAAE